MEENKIGPVSFTVYKSKFQLYLKQGFSATSGTGNLGGPLVITVTAWVFWHLVVGVRNVNHTLIEKHYFEDVNIFVKNKHLLRKSRRPHVQSKGKEEPNQH